MPSALLLECNGKTHRNSVRVDRIPAEVRCVSVDLSGFSDALLDAWMGSRVRPDDAAASVFQSRFCEALERAFGSDFVRIRTSYPATSSYRRNPRSGINRPRVETMATEGLLLDTMEVKATLSKSCAPTFAVVQDGFVMSETHYFGGTVALKAAVKHLKSVTNLRLHTYGVTLEPFHFSGASKQLEKLTRQERLCPVFGASLGNGALQGPLVLFLDCLDGALYRCSCTDRAYAQAAEEGTRDLPVQEFGTLYVEARNLLAESAVLDGICHRCLAARDGSAAANAAYGREFAKCPEAYGYLYAVESCTSLRSGTERFKAELGISRWKGEAELFETILKLLPNERIEREASPTWLNRQRFDIYLPERKLAVEYHGQQHFEPVEHFGGEDALRRRKERDMCKLDTAAANGVKVLVFRYDQPITMATVKQRVLAALS